MSNGTEAEKNIIFDAQAALPDKYTNRNSTFTAANFLQATLHNQGGIGNCFAQKRTIKDEKE